MTHNRYAYGNNNPYKFVDPDGELPVVVWGAYVAATAALTAYDSYQAYQEGGPSGLAKGAAAGVTMAAIPGGKIASKVAGKAVDLAKVTKGGDKSFQTYTKTNPTTGQTCCGRTNGCGTPEQNIARRDANHHMNENGYGPAVLDKSSSNGAAIRGREQQLIDAHGGAQLTGGTSGNRINGFSATNKNRSHYYDEARSEFGQ